MQCQIESTSRVIARMLVQIHDKLREHTDELSILREECLMRLNADYLGLCPDICIERRVDTFLQNVQANSICSANPD